MRLFRIACLLFFTIYLLSCGTERKIPNYLEHVTDTTVISQIIVAEPTFQKYDLISIQVYSASTDTKADAPYNLPPPPGLTAVSGSSGFLVDQNGNIEYPRIGTIQVEGLTKQQLADIIKTKLSGQLTDPSVIVRFQNYKITVLGEVGHQGAISVPADKINILEAMGLAGGITEYGKKERVKVLREINGKREIGYIDITSKQIFESPYYLLAQNDIVIIDPTQRKVRSTQRQEITQNIAFAFSIISSLYFLYSVVK